MHNEMINENKRFNCQSKNSHPHHQVALEEYYTMLYNGSISLVWQNIKCYAIHPADPNIYPLLFLIKSRNSFPLPIPKSLNNKKKSRKYTSHLDSPPVKFTSGTDQIFPNHFSESSRSPEIPSLFGSKKTRTPPKIPS